jgi:DNA-directed RNA polymerase specialized sigma24 family protein
MTKNELLDKLAEKYDDWWNMAKSFKVSDDKASELVQEMFIRIYDYVKEPKKILYNENEINTFYVYITLRNLYYSNLKGDKLTFVEEVKDYMVNEYELPKYFETSKKEHLEKVFNNVDSVVDTWYWYDRKMFELYYRTDMSMRDISSETKITLSSIFNTLSNAKKEIRQRLSEAYEEYKRTKE